MTRICAGIVTWCDGDALENAVRSIHGHVDEIVIVDGLIDGVSSDDAVPAQTDPDILWSLAERYGAASAQGRWATLSEMRNQTLEFARMTGCDWLLSIDADEELVNGETLRGWLDVWRYDAFPLPFYWEEGRAAHPAPFKCLHVPDWQRFVAQSAVLENQAGEIVNVNGQSTWTRPLDAGMPYLMHRPELRPEWRKTIRLSTMEVDLEPYPPETKAWIEPVYSPALLEPGAFVGSLDDAQKRGLPIWYCTGCGRRYAGPGSCEAQHEPIGLLPLDVAEGAKT